MGGCAVTEKNLAQGHGLTVDALKAVLSYDCDTGKFTWQGRTGQGARFNGKVAGTVHSSGYTHICLFGHLYKAHRLAWLYVYGDFPKQDIDHVNGKRDDNRICNLRDVSRSVNAQNQRAAQSHNSTSGLIGSSWSVSHKKWAASICVSRKLKHIGFFDSAEEAHAAYLTAKRSMHIGCTI